MRSRCQGKNDSDNDIVKIASFRRMEYEVERNPETGSFYLVCKCSNFESKIFLTEEKMRAHLGTLFQAIVDEEHQKADEVMEEIRMAQEMAHEKWLGVKIVKEDYDFYLVTDDDHNHAKILLHKKLAQKLASYLMEGMTHDDIIELVDTLSYGYHTMSLRPINAQIINACHLPVPDYHKAELSESYTMDPNNHGCYTCCRFNNTCLSTHGCLILLDCISRCRVNVYAKVLVVLSTIEASLPIIMGKCEYLIIYHEIDNIETLISSVRPRVVIFISVGSHRQDEYLDSVNHNCFDGCVESYHALTESLAENNWLIENHYRRYMHYMANGGWEDDNEQVNHLNLNFAPKGQDVDLHITTRDDVVDDNFMHPCESRRGNNMKFYVRKPITRMKSARK